MLSVSPQKRRKLGPGMGRKRTENGQKSFCVRALGRLVYLFYSKRMGPDEMWSHTGVGLIQLMPVLRIGTSIAVGSSSNTMFWLDRWPRTRLFAERFHALFVICSHPRLTVGAALHDIGTITFHRTFGALERERWEEFWSV